MTQQLEMPVRPRGRQRRSFSGVYNSRANHDPEATKNQRIAILKFFREHPQRKFSVDEIIKATGIKPSQTSVSSSVRDLRKPKFGGFDIPSGYDSDGIFRYRFAGEVPHE